MPNPLALRRGLNQRLGSLDAAAADEINLFTFSRVRHKQRERTKNNISQAWALIYVEVADMLMLLKFHHWPVICC